MMQIKTVIYPLECQTDYDKAVNALLADGWMLKKRTIIENPGFPTEAFHVCMERFLYAELEKHISPYPEEITL